MGYLHLFHQAADYPLFFSFSVCNYVFCFTNNVKKIPLLLYCIHGEFSPSELRMLNRMMCCTHIRGKGIIWVSAHSCFCSVPIWQIWEGENLRDWAWSSQNAVKNIISCASFVVHVPKQDIHFCWCSWQAKLHYNLYDCSTWVVLSGKIKTDFSFLELRRWLLPCLIFALHQWRRTVFLLFRR